MNILYSNKYFTDLWFQQFTHALEN